jgi:hypothetical protein
MIRIIKNISLLVFVCMIAMVLSCQAQTDPVYKMLIISQGDDFTGYFMLNTDTYDFSSVGSITTNSDNTTWYYTVTLNDLKSASKLKTLNVSATGKSDTTAIDFYLYKDDDLKKDVHDIQTTAGYIVKISFTGFAF